MNNFVHIVRNGLLKPHEQTCKEHIQQLFAQIKSDGFINNPIIADQNTHIILDGHHRFQVMQLLGLPCCLVYFCRL